jgi:hypothetical protein
MAEGGGGLQRPGEREQLKLFPSDVEPPADDPHVARVLIAKVRLERMRQFGACYLTQLWKRLELNRFLWITTRRRCLGRGVAAILTINRLCAPGSELAIEQGWYPTKPLDDLLGIEEEQINDRVAYLRHCHH